jgi:aminopeptidase N
MKQLMYLIGEENFSKAIGEYFNKYKFKNTELDDLLGCVEKYFPQMKEWKMMWLERAGGNLLSC